MRATAELRIEHARILRQASALSGLAGSRMTSEVAEQSRAVILGINQLLVDHLTHEDDFLYPALLAADDAQVRGKAQDCVEEMGGILGAWIAYRDRWTGPAIQSASDRFQAATNGVVGALAMRISQENTELYPMMDGLGSGPGPVQHAA